MIEQRDVDDLLIELETMRMALIRDRNSIKPKLDELISRSKQMRENAAGGKYEASVASVHGLLVSLRAGVQAQEQLNRAA